MQAGIDSFIPIIMGSFLITFIGLVVAYKIFEYFVNKR